MKRVLLSACLVGEPVRYDGQDKRTHHPVLEAWLAEGRVVTLCPEVAGGLSIPRAPAERLGARVVTAAGADVTAAFVRGAGLALELVRAHDICVAVLKEGSPSCGSSQIADGSFSRTRIEGEGLTTELLRGAGVAVFSELEFEQARAYLLDLEARQARYQAPTFDSLLTR